MTAAAGQGLPSGDTQLTGGLRRRHANRNVAGHRLARLPYDYRDVSCRQSALSARVCERAAGGTYGRAVRNSRFSALQLDLTVGSALAGQRSPMQSRVRVHHDWRRYHAGTDRGRGVWMIVVTTLSIYVVPDGPDYDSDSHRHGRLS
jgi:hypothetical protein